MNYGLARLINTTVSGNHSSTSASVIHNSNGTITLIHTTIANNHASSFAGGLSFQEGEFIGTNSNPKDPLLGPLADNGGPTHTMHPRAGSPVINSALGTDGSPANDQRGEARGPLPDIGAVENLFCRWDLDRDRDVDGFDLAKLFENPEGFPLNFDDFAAQFGRLGGCIE